MRFSDNAKIIKWSLAPTQTKKSNRGIFRSRRLTSNLGTQVKRKLNMYTINVNQYHIYFYKNQFEGFSELSLLVKGCSRLFFIFKGFSKQSYNSSRVFKDHLPVFLNKYLNQFENQLEPLGTGYLRDVEAMKM